MTEDKIREAVARGWTHPDTEDRVMDAELAEAISGEVTLEVQQWADMIYRAWSIIANAGTNISHEGNGWENESEEWQEAALKWRDDFHDLLKEIVNV